MPRVYHKHYSKPIPEGAQHTTVEIRRRGKKVKVPAVRFRGSDNKWVVAPLTAKGDRCRVPSPTYYGWVNGEEVPLCANQAASGHGRTSIFAPAFTQWLCRR
jgi:hypothetical protein